MRNKVIFTLCCFLFLSSGVKTSFAQETEQYTLFDDKSLLEGYAKKNEQKSKEILLAMIKDDSLSPYECAAAVRVLKNTFSQEIFGAEKKSVEKTLIYRLNHTDSSFVQVEIMHTLCLMDRYQYFNSMVPLLIQSLDHYNKVVNEIAYNSLDHLIKTGHSRPREARIVFNTLRKIFFLSRKKLKDLKEPGTKLKQKLELLRWSVKILGNQELRKLPPEIINFL
ncbi:MAG: hypothetical protein WC676_06755 [Candidatus Omnitrophota bacterium]